MSMRVRCVCVCGGRGGGTAVWRSEKAMSAWPDARVCVLFEGVAGGGRSAGPDGGVCDWRGERGDAAREMGYFAAQAVTWCVWSARGER